MTKTKKTLIALSLFLTFFVLAAGPATQAQSSDLVPCSGIVCKWCDVFELIQTVINTGLLVIAPIIIIFIFYGGILYILGSSSGSDEQITKAKSTVVSAIVGMVIVLLTWAIINSVVLGLTGQPLFRFAAIDCDEILAPSTDTGPPVPPPPGPPGPPGPPSPPSDTLDTDGDGIVSEEEARAYLAGSGIPVNKGACPPGVPYQNVAGGCTSTAGLRPETIDGTIAFQEECGCNVIITGGSELGHSAGQYSHGSGHKVDYGLNPQINAYIENNYEYVGVRGDGAPLYKSPNGDLFAKESDHWDVLYYS